MKANFRRFKWIPMIVKAYNQARLFTDENSDASTRSMNVTGPTSVGMNSGHPTPAKPDRPSSDMHKVSSKRRSAAASTTRADNQRPLHKPVDIPYQRMLRELRQTKTKLGQLESIHRRLAESQVQLQSQLSQLLTELKAHEAKPSEPKTPDEE